MAVAPDIDFLADPEVVRIVVEGYRLGYGHLANPGFGAEVSLIDPLPHQRLAVYGPMLSERPLRFLLADDAGAGKTIMTGLYIREMLSRRLLRRVLIVPPAGLVTNWNRELRNLFSLTPTVLRGPDALVGNPFVGPDSDLVIVSVDTLAGDRMFARLAEPEVEPYDLVVFDEAHKLAAREDPDGHIRKTDRYRLAEALAAISPPEPSRRLPWRARNILLLTATPHMGKDFPYYCLWRLLEPEALSTEQAFKDYPASERRRHFIRRTKEEMVDYSGRPLFPTRVSDTLSYDLTPEEQRLYDQTTAYIGSYYNRARLLNRTAARLAMSVFQRRLASSTYAMARSFERRLEKLDRLIDDLRTGRLSTDQLLARQTHLNALSDPYEESTADEEEAAGDREGLETAEERLLGGVVAVNLAELQTEKAKVEELLALAGDVMQAGSGAKFEKLLEVLRDPRFRDEKFIIFTEHRDTLEFLTRRLEAIGYGGRVARIHGGLDSDEREAQIEFFRTPAAEGGAGYLVATDAAGEGINLQFCWLMVNYDIPWNPARLEQRMGRIHRYLQKHDPVFVTNLLAGQTREGRVLRILLEKLERIRRELGSDKVFDVVGRLFEGLSFSRYMEKVLTDGGLAEATAEIEGRLTRQQVEALEARERRLFGDGGDVKRELPRLQADLEREDLRRLLPGYVRHFVERAAPLIQVGLLGNPEGEFSFVPLKPGALDPLSPALERYPAGQRNLFSLERPSREAKVIFLRPGEPVFERLREHVCGSLEGEALRGGVFVDPYAQAPYLFHVALFSVVRRADPAIAGLEREELLEQKLIGLRQEEDGSLAKCPVEHLLLLRGGRGLPAAGRLAAAPAQGRESAAAWVGDEVAASRVEDRRESLRATLPARKETLARGFNSRLSELAARRKKLRERVEAGDGKAELELEAVKREQERVEAESRQAASRLEREADLIAAGDVVFLAHAFVAPSIDPEERSRHDARVEALAMSVAIRYEEDLGAVVKDVSTPDRARAAGLGDRPGFDLLSVRPDGETLAIEVKGRATGGQVEVTNNEWAQALNQGPRYWFYVVYGCATPAPALVRVKDPFNRLLAQAKGSVLINQTAILEAAEE